VAVPGATPDADLVEHALPEQFTSSYQDGRFVTVPVSHSGG
jgi:adenylyl cyclase-associated protein